MNKLLNAVYEKLVISPDINTRIVNYFNQSIEDPSNTTLHFHRAAEILFVEHGQLEVSSLDSAYTLKSNDFIFINSDVIHRTRVIEDNSVIHVIQFELFTFSHGSLQSDILYRFISQGNKPFYLANKFSDITMYNAICEIITEKYNQKPSYDLVIKSDILRLSAHLNRKKIIFNSFQNDTQKKAFLKLSPLLEYVLENYCTPISLDELCRKFSISKGYFCKQFKLLTDKTFYDFLIHMKIKHSMQLLSQSDKYITDIAYECGFNSLSYFNKTFKKITGYSPSEYRKFL